MPWNLLHHLTPCFRGSPLVGSQACAPGAWLTAESAKAYPVVASISWSRTIVSWQISKLRLGGTIRKPCAMSWMRPAQLDKFIPERSFGKPPRGGILSIDGGIATNEQALKACTCSAFNLLSPCRGALKALTYHFAPSSISRICGKDSQGESSSECIWMYSHLQ